MMIVVATLLLGCLIMRLDVLAAEKAADMAGDISFTSNMVFSCCNESVVTATYNSSWLISSAGAERRLCLCGSYRSICTVCRNGEGSQPARDKRNFRPRCGNDGTFHD